MPINKTVRFGIKYGKFALVYEWTVEKSKPVRQIETPKPKLLADRRIDTYA